MDKALLQCIQLLDDPSQIKFAYQPIFDAKTGQIYGYEALMRPYPFTPLEFIGLARQCGRLQDIENITIYYGMKGFIDADLEGKAFYNTLPEVSMSTEYIEKSCSLGGSRMKNRNIYEILEYSSFNMDAWIAKIRAIRASNSNAQFAVDDYGSGSNSNPDILKQYLPFIVKIDRKFITNVDADKTNQAIVDRMMKVIRSNGALVLGEGVETKGECDYLTEHGVDLLQGYYLGRPKIYSELNVYTPKKKASDLRSFFQHGWIPVK